MSFCAARRSVLASGLKAARHAAGLSAKDAAELISAAGVRCTRGTLLAWERGIGTTSREPYGSDLPVIVAVYRCTIADLFRFTPMETVSALSGAAEAAGTL
jgi:transcriptional regulator with XRE-family HTH domain